MDDLLDVFANAPLGGCPKCFPPYWSLEPEKHGRRPGCRTCWGSGLGLFLEDLDPRVGEVLGTLVRDADRGRVTPTASDVDRLLELATLTVEVTV